MVFPRRAIPNPSPLKISADFSAATATPKTPRIFFSATKTDLRDGKARLSPPQSAPIPTRKFPQKDSPTARGRFSASQNHRLFQSEKPPPNLSESGGIFPARRRDSKRRLPAKCRLWIRKCGFLSPPIIPASACPPRESATRRTDSSKDNFAAI